MVRITPCLHVPSAAMPAARALLTAALAGALSVGHVDPALALGPKDLAIGLTVNGYAETECPEELAQGRAGGALGAGAGGAGIAQKCVTVKATVTNESGKTVKDAGVFGSVIELQSGMSVLGNGQDGKNDAGQFAMIPSIEPGKSNVEFLFVSQQVPPFWPWRVPARPKFRDPG